MELAKTLFEEQSTLSSIVRRIMELLLSLLRCERCSILMVDESSKVSYHGNRKREGSLHLFLFLFKLIGCYIQCNIFERCSIFVMAEPTNVNYHGNRKREASLQILLLFLFKLMVYCNECDISSVESQKGIIIIQQCSIENQKSTIAVPSV